MMEGLFQQLRYAVRTLGRSPGFSFVVVLILALGIGANTAIFSFVNGVLLSSLPFPEPDRLITLGERNLEKGGRLSVVSPRNLEDWEKQVVRSSSSAHGDWRFKINTRRSKSGVGRNRISGAVHSSRGQPRRWPSVCP
jgi:hypothetical protein